jgi:hypothetical protein
LVVPAGCTASLLALVVPEGAAERCVAVVAEPVHDTPTNTNPTAAVTASFTDCSTIGRPRRVRPPTYLTRA